MSTHQFRKIQWKILVFLSSSSFASLSPASNQAAAFHSSRHTMRIGGRRRAIMVPAVTPPSVPAPVASGSCLRRSTRNQRAIQPRGVRLFRDQSLGNNGTEEASSALPKKDELESMRVVDLKQLIKDLGLNERGLFSRLKKKQDLVDFLTSSNNIPMAGTTLDAEPVPPTTPARGSQSIPVTPEPATSAEHDPTKPASSSKRKRTREAKATTKPKKKTSAKALVAWPAPDGWKETYELVRELRKDKTAPCDFMGAEALVLPAGDKPSNGTNEEEHARTSRFQTLIALMLSSQTKDAMVGQAMKNLRNESDGSGGLTVASILAMDSKVLNSKIYSVGFRNNKTKYIKQAAQILRDNYDDDIPPTADEMMELPGVGPKMAYIVENICWGTQTGIGVDTHMQRLFPKLGWVSPDTRNPEQTRKQLESWLPHEYWGEVNLLWVGFGQEVQQEREKVLRKALLSSRPLRALELLQSVGFKVRDEWNKLLDGDDQNVPWADEDQREKMIEMIETVCSANE